MLTVSCNLDGTASAAVFEGITATKGFVDYFQPVTSEEPPPAPATATLFHVITEEGGDEPNSALSADWPAIAACAKVNCACCGDQKPEQAPDCTSSSQDWLPPPAGDEPLVLRNAPDKHCRKSNADTAPGNQTSSGRRRPQPSPPPEG